MFEFLYGAWLKCLFNRNQSSLKITCFRGKKQSLMTAQWDRWLREEHNVMGRIWWYLVVLNSTRIPCSLVRPRAFACSINFWLGTGLAVNGLEFDYWPRGSGNVGLLNLFDVLLQFYLPLSLTFSFDSSIICHTMKVKTCLLFSYHQIRLFVQNIARRIILEPKYLPFGQFRFERFFFCLQHFKRNVEWIELNSY